jgi:hypothetical protein
LVEVMSRYGLFVSSASWLGACIAFASRASGGDTLDWLLGGALACFAAFLAHEPLRLLLRRGSLPAAWHRTAALAPVALAGGVVLGLLVLDLRPVLLGWLLLPLGAHVGCALEACLPEHQHP